LNAVISWRFSIFANLLGGPPMLDTEQGLSCRQGKKHRPAVLVVWLAVESISARRNI